MNFWKRYPADYQRKTARLTLAQHGAYTLLLDELYTAEAPLPADIGELYRICRAMNKAEQEAVRFVADRFFPIHPDGARHNKRAAEELEEAAPALKAARENGAKGGRPKKPTGLPDQNPAGSQSGTQTKPSAKPPQISELREEKDSVAIATAAAAAQVDAVEAVFALGIPLLTAAGVPELRARSFLGRLRKFNTDTAVVQAIDRCAKAHALQPVEFLQGCLKTSAHFNRQEAQEQDGKRVAAEWLREQA